MNDDKNIKGELPDIEMSLEEMAVEIVDMLGVALHFAGAKKQCVDNLIELYSTEMDKFYEHLPEDSPYGQDEMLEIIKSLKKTYPQFFNA